MKKVIITLLMCSILIIIVLNINPLSDKVVSFLEVKKNLVLLPTNEYTKNKDYIFVQRTKDYLPYGYQDLLNIIYSTLDNGWQNFTFYCPAEYVNCIKDVKQIANDKDILAHINNYVHPYNGYKNIILTYDDSGEVNIEVGRLYDQKLINTINPKVKQIIDELNLKDLPPKDQILLVHDYVINNAKYDSARADYNDQKYQSNTAYGPLFEGQATCSGYTEVIALMLSELGFDNIKVSSSRHTWNAIKIDGVWYHLDATWDDPISSNGLDNLFHNYFLISTAQLLEIDQGKEDVIHHIFPEYYYWELKKEA